MPVDLYNTKWVYYKMHNNRSNTIPFMCLAHFGC